VPASPPTAYLLGAPTASGKSAVALRLAERFGMEIVAADAMQVYRGLDVGTAKPSPAERARVPHHLIDVVDPDRPFSVADWAPRAEAAILDAARRGVACLVVGGTGFYLQALAEGLPTTPPADAEAQAPLWARLEAEGVAPLAAELADAAPEDAARADRNPRRVVRALEVLRRTGRPPSAFPRRPPRVRVDRTWLIPTMAELEPRIEARARAMLAGGLVEEAAALDAAAHGAAAHGAGALGALATASQAIGYAEAAAVARGELDREAALAALVVATRRYARRQRTWFRKHAAERRFACLAEAAEAELAAWLAAAGPTP
jgi:tRNA dimethylallyltransferase